MYYNIDVWDHTNNTYQECVAVWSTNNNDCIYADYMQNILKNGGEWDAPDGCTYIIHQDQE